MNLQINDGGLPALQVTEDSKRNVSRDRSRGKSVENVVQAIYKSLNQKASTPNQQSVQASPQRETNHFHPYPLPTGSRRRKNPSVIRRLSDENSSIDPEMTASIQRFQRELENKIVEAPAFERVGLVVTKDIENFSDDLDGPPVLTPQLRQESPVFHVLLPMKLDFEQFNLANVDPVVEDQTEDLLPISTPSDAAQVGSRIEQDPLFKTAFESRPTTEVSVPRTDSPPRSRRYNRRPAMQKEQPLYPSNNAPIVVPYGQTINYFNWTQDDMTSWFNHIVYKAEELEQRNKFRQRKWEGTKMKTFFLPHGNEELQLPTDVFNKVKDHAGAVLNEFTRLKFEREMKELEEEWMPW